MNDDDANDGYDDGMADIRVIDWREPSSPEDWLWCLSCNRFFQAKRLRVDFLANRQGCAFCSVAGFGVEIWPWDAWRSEGWPESTSELRHGLVQR